MDPGPDRRTVADTRSPSPKTEDLRGFIAHRLAQLSARLTVQRDAPVSEDDIREAQLLRELTLLSDTHQRTQPRRRSPVPWLFGLTALAITMLVFVRLPSIRADADLLCSAVRFSTESSIQLTGLSRLTLLQATAFAPLELEEAMTLQRVPVTAPVELRPAASGLLTLSSISIPAGATVSLQRTDDTGTWGVEIEHPDAAVSATAAGSVEVASSAAPPRQMGFGRGVRINLRAASGDVPRLSLDITPRQVDTLLAGHLVPIRTISFTQAVQEPAPDGAGLLRGEASSVLHGSVLNVSLGGRELLLRRRDAIEMTITNGQIRELRLTNEGLRVSVSAVATELRVGRVGGLQTLRPSYLEWFAQHHRLKLAWGSAVWLLGLMLGGMKWWRESAV